MTDTLRSIVDGMEHKEFPRILDPEHPLHSPTTCPKCRLLALQAEMEKVDLVKKWRELGDGLQCDIDDTCCHSVCADELATWLAVNLESIKERP